jgi:hypothetical protein
MVTANLLSDVKRTVGHEFSFKSGETFYWSPENNTIYYDKARLTEEIGGWSLLHELAHATLKHKNYNSDYDLLMMEVAAWDKAQGIAQQFGLTIDQDHVDECVDTTAIGYTSAAPAPPAAPSVYRPALQSIAAITAILHGTSRPRASAALIACARMSPNKNRPAKTRGRLLSKLIC